jgi:hypothetical protein
MKTKTNRKVKRSKKTRRTRRNLRKVRGGGFGFIEKGRIYMEWRKRRNKEMDDIDTSYRKCKLACETKHDEELRDVKDRYKKEWANTTVAKASQVTSLTKIHTMPNDIELQQQREKDEYVQSGAADQVAEYIKKNKSATDGMGPMEFKDLPKHDLHREKTPTDNGWYVHVDQSNPENAFLRNTNDSNFNLKTYGIQNDYEAHLKRLPNPLFKYKSPIPSSPGYILVQEGTGELKWKNLVTGKLIEFSPVWPLLATNDQGYEVVLQSTVELAQEGTIGTSDP